MRALKHAAFPYILAIIALFSSFTRAQTLSERAIYERCYSRLVRQTPQANDPYVPAIVAGSLTGAEACKRLLNLAQFSGERIPMYSAEPEKLELAKRVLSSMQDVHVSWFHFKSIEIGNTCTEAATNGIIDPHEPALMLTKAMFSGSFNMENALTTRTSFRAVRSVHEPAYSIQLQRVGLPLQGYPNSIRYIDHGDLLGVRAGPDPLVELRALSKYPGETVVPTRNARILKNHGGGILGSPAYLMTNFDEMMMVPNLETLPRNWSKYVFKDLLCRDLPVIKEVDAEKYQVCPQASCAIKPSAADAPKVFSFRREKACVQCHASMDQLAGLTRNMRPFRSGACTFKDTGDTYATNALAPNPTPLAATGNWGYVADANYHKHAPNGRFMFRTFRDTLVNQPVDDLNELGALIASLDDYYVCAAKRYYQYFTGVDVPIAPMTAAQVNALPPDRKFYRARVIGLGLKLKSMSSDGFKKDPAKLVEAIFALPEYKMKDFDLVRKAQP